MLKAIISPRRKKVMSIRLNISTAAFFIPKQFLEGGLVH